MNKFTVLHNSSMLRNELVQIFYKDMESASTIKNLITEAGFSNVIESSEYLYIKASLVVIVCGDYSECEKRLVQTRQDDSETPVIIVSQTSETEDIVEIMKKGAYDYFSVPIDARRFVMASVRAVERTTLLRALDDATFNDSYHQFKNKEAFAHIITANSSVLKILKYLETIIDSPHPVLITGETGVGKELFARTIYLLCKGSEFVTLNIAGLDDTIFSDTLFGHKKGAFTGAETSRDGLIAKASSGVLFLDEIGDLSDMNQIKLLRLIQEREYYPIGADTPSQLKCKLVLATNINLEKAVNNGTFRKDLFYRINTHHIQIPPLSSRMDDLPLLLSYFITKAAKTLGKKEPTIPPELLILLSCYDFPGNVRELEAMVNDAMARHKSGSLSMATFEEKIRPSVGRAVVADYENVFFEYKSSSFPTLKEMEYALIAKAMMMASNNQRVAAGMLGISRQALNKRLNNNDNNDTE